MQISLAFLYLEDDKMVRLGPKFHTLDTIGLATVSLAR
jgi:hypothetical protein